MYHSESEPRSWNGNGEMLRLETEKNLSENNVCAEKVIWYGGVYSGCNGDPNLVTEWAQSIGGNRLKNYI